MIDAAALRRGDGRDISRENFAASRESKDADGDFLLGYFVAAADEVCFITVKEVKHTGRGMCARMLGRDERGVIQINFAT